MNAISNIWKHPKTSVAGALIAVASVAGALAQQGVTLGTADGSTVVSLVGAVATALLGLLAKDPGKPENQSASQAANPAAANRQADRSASASARLGAWALIALLLPLPWMQGCSGTAVAQDIVNWTPSLESAVATVDSTAALLAPADAPVFTAATAGFDAGANLLATQAKAYLANPSAGTLAQLQNQVVAFEQQVNAALLAAGKIVNPASQQHALAAIQAVGTIVTAMLALVQSASSKTAVARMAAESSIKLAQVEPYWNRAQSAHIVASHYDEPVSLAQMQVAQVEQDAIRAGF